MKNLFFLSSFLFIFIFQSKAQLNEALSATIVGTEILQETFNHTQNLNPLVLKVNEIQKKMYQLAQSDANFQAKITELEQYTNEGKTAEATNLLKGGFGIKQSELDEIQYLANQFNEGYTGSNKELESLIETRVNSLRENNILDLSYLPGESPGTAPSTDGPCCWCIAAVGIVGSVGAVIGGCAGGPVGCAAGAAVAASNIASTTGRLCRVCGNCSGSGW